MVPFTSLSNLQCIYSVYSCKVYSVHYTVYIQYLFLYHLQCKCSAYPFTVYSVHSIHTVIIPVQFTVYIVHIPLQFTMSIQYMGHITVHIPVLFTGMKNRRHLFESIQIKDRMSYKGFDYTCFADATPFEKKLLKGRLLILLMRFFIIPIKIKPIFHIIKKYVCNANIFASQKMFLFGVILSIFSLCNVYNNLFRLHVRGICTSETVPPRNYIGRQLDVSYIGRQVYEEIFYLSDKNLA